ncbi:MAG: D-aminoacylase [Pyrinomonadaceae bacterium]|nr:D-aminoacylase [Blastocatellia bacterium]MCW5956729.1 D-aminoacylase [Pyrinomonadaceae bacterium]
MKVKTLLVLAAIFVSAVNAAFAQSDERFDLVINNARIVDGTGNPWFHGSIGVRDGKIIKISRFELRNAAKTIDANGQIVAPGFIDVHAHTEDIFSNPTAENFIRMGVTSLVTGNCGGSVTDVGEFLGRFKEKPLAINLATLIAHGSVRSKVMGLDDRAPTAEEQQKMNGLVEQGMKDGAVGLSTGLIYVPGTFAKTDEVIELAKVASRYGGTYASHIRNEGNEVVDAIKEAINIGEQANMPVEISHFKIASRALWGQTATTIGLVEDARRRGLTVTVDQYAYTASSTSLDSRMPSWAIAGGREEGKKRLADPATKARIITEMKEWLKKAKFKDFSFAYVASYRANPEFNGRNIAEISRIVRGKKKLDDQLEQIFDMYQKGGAQMVYRQMDEPDVQNIMRQPFTMIASDSGVRQFGSGVPHPRGYGNNARVLGRYVRELKIITLEDAIRKMTSLPAQTFNLRDRGQIREGFAADIVIFDDAKVTDKATYETPHQYAEGFSNVIVNGQVVFDGSRMTGTMSGEPLKGTGKSN